MSDPKLIGLHNADPGSAERLATARGYQDLSTVCVVPTRGTIQARVVESWMGLMPAMNQKFTRLFVSGLEVAAAYNLAIETILGNEELSKWKYVLTLEEDNIPSPDSLLKLYESIGDYSAVGGLYWTKGPGGQPMVYGSPGGIMDFMPQMPDPDTVQECNGLGMGFTLFKLEMFRDEKIPRPWFQTLQEWRPDEGGKSATQDLYFFGNARRAGHRVACDTRVKIGHLEEREDIVW